MKKPKGSNKIIVAKILREDSDFTLKSRSICLGRIDGIERSHNTPASRVPPDASLGRFPGIRHERRSPPGAAWHPERTGHEGISAENSLHKLLAMYDKAVRILAESLVPGMHALMEDTESPEDEAPPVPPARRNPRQR